MNLESIIYTVLVSVSPIKKKTELYRRSPTSTKHIKKTQQRSGDCVGVAKTLVHIVGTYSMHIYAVGNPLNLRKWTLLKCEVIPPIFVNIQRVLDCNSTTFARNIYHTVSLFLKTRPKPLAELLDLSLLTVCLGLITILLHEYLWPFNKFGFVCLFDASFIFLYKTYPGFPQAAWQTQISHLQF